MQQAEDHATYNRLVYIINRAFVCWGLFSAFALYILYLSESLRIQNPRFDIWSVSSVNSLTFDVESTTTSNHEPVFPNDRASSTSENSSFFKPQSDAFSWMLEYYSSTSINKKSLTLAPIRPPPKAFEEYIYPNADSVFEVSHRLEAALPPVKLRGISVTFVTARMAS
jgi:hypothetical protein